MSGFETPAADAGGAWKPFFWPALVTGLLLGHVLIVTGALLLSSALIPAASTAPAGYAEALRWDEERAVRRASNRLGWTLVVDPAPHNEPSGERLVTFTLLDAGGRPINDAALRVAMYHHGQPGAVVEAPVPAIADEPGVYRAHLRLRREGQWRLSAKAERDADRFLVDTDLWLSKAGRTPREKAP